MKTSTIASALLGLLSSPVVSAEEPLQLKIPSGDDQYVFTLTKFMDGRSKPYRVYFWDDMLTGSSYRVDQNGDVVYFKAGSEVYFKMKEAEDGSITFKMKEERKMQKTVEEGSRRRKMLMTKDVMSDNDVEITKDMVVNEDRVMLSEDDERTAQCTECMDDLDVIGFTLPKFCQYVDFHSLGSDGQKSVKILCGYEKVLVDGLESICYDICYGKWVLFSVHHRRLSPSKTSRVQSARSKAIRGCGPSKTGRGVRVFPLGCVIALRAGYNRSGPAAFALGRQKWT